VLFNFLLHVYMVLFGLLMSSSVNGYVIVTWVYLE
jgi:hypothetical protein